MKLNKIISSVLVLVTAVTSLFGLVPVSSSADSSTTEVNIAGVSDVISDADQIKEINQNYLRYNFSTAYEMLTHELSLGYLDYIREGNYAVYVNRYTGFMYYVNLLTGQILTSNPIDPSYMTVKEDNPVPIGDEEDVMSQLFIEYFALSNSSISYKYYSLRWIMEGSLISVSKYEDDGIAVEYTLGNAVSSFISPSVILLDDANEHLLHPAFNKLAKMMEQKCGDYDEDIAFDAGVMNVESGNYNILDNNIYRQNSDLYSGYSINGILDDYKSYALEYFGNAANADYKEISSFIDAIKIIFSSYDLINETTATDILKEKIGALNEGKSIMLLKGADTGDTTAATCRQVEKAIKLISSSYTFEMAEEHEAKCGFTATSLSVPVFKITMIYKIEDGALTVSIPANLIKFDEETYSIKSITPLKYFGAGDMNNDGYVFYPDGSGAIINFSDFYYGSNSEEANSRISISSPIYGSDFCYSSITGAHREQIVMPVYGMSSDVNASDLGLASGKGSVTNGYFAIIEEGASLVTLGCESGGGIHKYITVFNQFSPYPTDTYDLSQSISVSGLGIYTVVAAPKYDHSLKIRFEMLEDEEINDQLTSLDSSYGGYKSSYVGMAACYRDFLEDQGVIELLEDSYSDLPLYIEVLGSIDVIERFLSFPVTVSTPLTTFDDVARMYSELSNARETLIAKADLLEKEAGEIELENNPDKLPTAERNRRFAAELRDLASRVSDIKNINFKLNGFTNGGMYATYPAKVRWESSVGGKNGFSNLISKATEESSKEGQTFGIYPDFDFMYINNTGWFDGISNNIAACMVDNRYASKQTYNSINQMFETTFALVVSSGSFDELYSKFIKEYSKYSVGGVSVSTLGSDLNSNFDEDNPVIRESSISSVKSLLGQLSANYSVMADKGNIYTVEFLDHILNAPLDSSHLNNSSYAIPFYGMVLHGYVNYAGTPINYSGSPEYDILRAIENGASLYYILCTQNTAYLKEDSYLSQYYGVDYENWFDKIVEQSSIIDGAIGDLQTFRIVDHSTLLSERVVNEKDQKANNERLISEFLYYVDLAISTKIDEAIKEMREDDSLIGAGLKFAVSQSDIDLLIDNCAERMNISNEMLTSDYGIRESISQIVDSYTDQYSEGKVEVTITPTDINYKSKYKYVTDSKATDDNYIKTDFTCDNGNVVMVTYEKVVNGEKEKVVFLLNYNVFSVKIRIDESVHENFKNYCDKDGYITLDSFTYVRIEG